jgi:hypothetical protein
MKKLRVLPIVRLLSKELKPGRCEPTEIQRVRCLGFLRYLVFDYQHIAGPCGFELLTGYKLDPVVPVQRIPDGERLASVVPSPCQHNEISIFEESEY